MAQLVDQIDALISFIDKTCIETKTDDDDIDFRSSSFILQHLQRSMDFFNPKRCIDIEGGGFYHFYGDDGTVYDKTTRILVTQARFIFTYGIAYQYFNKKEYLNAVCDGIKYLRGAFKNNKNGSYHWILKNGKPTDSKIYTYGLSFVLLAYSKAFEIGANNAKKEYISETFNLMEKYMFESKYGLYAEEADLNWNKTDYRSQSGNLHATEALIVAYKATKDIKYLSRAILISNNICNKIGGLCQGLIWEHYNNEWIPNIEFNNNIDELKLYRPWGFQPGHQVEWARLLLILSLYKNDIIWFIPKAKYLFDIAIKQSWDNIYGGLSYSFDLNGNICDYDKIFWVHCESLGTASMLAIITGDNKYWKQYDKIWKYCWKYFVDHKHGSWYRRCNRQFNKYFYEKTKLSKCVDPDYHILGAFDGMLTVINHIRSYSI